MLIILTFSPSQPQSPIKPFGPAIPGMPWKERPKISLDTFILIILLLVGKVIHKHQVFCPNC